jgi:hypothetical protein
MQQRRPARAGRGRGGDVGLQGGAEHFIVGPHQEKPVVGRVQRSLPPLVLAPAPHEVAEGYGTTCIRMGVKQD